MKRIKISAVSRFFNRVSATVTRFAGRPLAFILAVVLVLGWAFTGFIFDYSETWQLFINTGTTIITFLMVFIIQQSQNRDALALQLKLNELIASHEKASNRLVDVEDLTEEELILLKKFYVRLSKLAEKENDLFSSHSIDEAEKYHGQKLRSHSPVPNKPNDAKKPTGKTNNP